jgi:secreted trypsin-like serine protease
MFGLNRASGSAVTMAAATVAAATLLASPAVAAAPRPVVGGSTTSTSAYPFMMQITDARGGQFCGGSLVAARKVVTAAHCVTGETPRSIRVVGGRTYLNATNGTVARVSRIWTDPGYKNAARGDDVAVLTLSRPMPYRPVPYVSAADTDVYTAGTTARVLGWGATTANGPSANQLRTATVPVVSDESCRSSYGSDYVASDMVCAGYSSGGVDTCQGDSGGPLLVRGVLAGITSWGEGCAEAGHPGVYTRLATFSGLVAAQVGP